MMRVFNLRLLLTALLCSSVVLSAAELNSTQKRKLHSAAQHGGHSVPQMLIELTKSRALDNGIEVSSGKAVVRVTALRDDIIRVRISRDGVFSQNHSWAVLPEMIRSATKVTSLNSRSSNGRPGFKTSQLQAEIDSNPLRVIIADRSGRVLSQDFPGRPTTFFGDQFKVYKSSPEDEHYYGLGDKPGPLDRRNRAFQLWNTDAFGFQESTDPIYKSLPFFLAVRKGISYGVFLDNTWRTNFNFNVELNDALSFGSDGGDLDYYFIYGPEAKQVIAHFTDLVGRTPLPPLWALGFHQSRYSYDSEARVLEIVKTFREKSIPLDAIYLDIGFQDQNRPFTVDRKSFPHFERMVQTLAEQNVRTLAITDLHIPRLAEGYTPFDSGMTGDHFVKASDGSMFVGKVWPGPSVFPDFTRKSTREWWGTLYRDFYLQAGVSGFWNDMNEPSVFDVPSKTMPLDNQHRIDDPDLPKRTATHREVHNVYGMLNTKATYEGLLQLNPNQRPFVLTRASYAGGWRYAATWTGDNTSSWNHLRMSTPQLMNMGLSGYTLVGDDIGGFGGTPTADLLTRWIELGTFNPIDRDHTAIGTADQEPWVHGPEHEAIRKRYIDMRYQLMPYLYTTVEEATRTGIPIMRPLFLEYTDTDLEALRPETVDQQFLFGRALMVAPQPVETLDKYEVKLPAGPWYDFWTGKNVSTSAPVQIEPRLDTLPVYARGGSIIPMQSVTRSTGEVPQGPLQLLVFPGQDCQGSIYLDDGKTLSYKQGAFLRQSYSCSVQQDTLQITLGSHQGSYQPWWRQIRLTIHGATHPAKSVYVDNSLRKDVSFDKERGAMNLLLDSSSQGAVVRIEY